MAVCPYCGVSFNSTVNVHQHQTQAAQCRKQRDAKFGNALNRVRRKKRTDEHDTPIHSNPAMDVDMTDVEPTMAAMEDLQAGGQEPDVNVEPDNDALPPRIVEVDDVDAPRTRWRECCPVETQAGAASGTGKTTFERIRDEQILTGAEVLGPFKDDAEWELAKWLIKNVGHTAADALLKLPIVGILLDV